MKGERLSNCESREWRRGQPAVDALLINDRRVAPNSVAVFSATPASVHSTSSGGVACFTDCSECRAAQPTARDDLIGRLVADVTRTFLGHSGVSSQPVELEIRLRVGPPVSTTVAAADVVGDKQRSIARLSPSSSTQKNLSINTLRFSASTRPRFPPPSRPLKDYGANYGVDADMSQCDQLNKESKKTVMDYSTGKTEANRSEQINANAQSPTQYEPVQDVPSSDQEHIPHSVVETEVNKELADQLLRRSRSNDEVDTVEAFGSEID